MASARNLAWFETLETIDGLDVQYESPLAAHTSWRIGGPAEALVTAHDLRAAMAALEVASRAGVEITVLGGGTNVLVADEGVRGLVLRFGSGLDEIVETQSDDVRVIWRVGAGCGNGRLVQRALREGLRGLEGLAGVPGKLGGALKMNAGGNGGQVGDIVRRVRVIDRGEVRWIGGVEAGFAYRTSCFSKAAVLVAAELELWRDEEKEVRERVEKAQAHRRATQPVGKATAGSTFKNPAGDFAGRLIEAAGCKGWSEGGAEVSQKHANFIINRGDATARDVMSLIERVRERILERFGVRLELEVRLIGGAWGGGDA